jgi:FkbM family methyltransferase
MEIKTYAQNKEDLILLNLFKDYKGTLLDIGANDGNTLSNSRLFIDNGWSALLVEPSPEAFEKLVDLHDNNEKVFCLNVAVSNYNGIGTFYHSGTHLNKGDISLLSSLNKNETERWHKEKFEEIKVPVVTFEKMLSYSPYKEFDLVLIDAEGIDKIILQQMNFNSLKAKAIVVEWNCDTDLFDWFYNFLSPFGFGLLHQNAENLIFVRN